MKKENKATNLKNPKKAPHKSTEISKSKKISPAKKSSEKKISDKAVLTKTGKNFQEWFLILDKVAADKINHKEKAKFLVVEFPEIDPWWAQTIVVNYEQTRGLRQKHEKPDGFEISVSKTIDIPLKTLFEVWTDDKIRGEWLTETIYVHKTILNKCIRFDWFDGSPLEINFYDKGKNKSQVVVQHSKLTSATAAEKMKIFWQEALERLLKIIKVTYGIK